MLLTEADGALAMRALYEDLDEEEQLRDLYEGQVRKDGSIAAEMNLLPPPGRTKPGCVPLCRFEAWKLGTVGVTFEELTVGQ